MPETVDKWGGKVPSVVNSITQNEVLVPSDCLLVEGCFDETGNFMMNYDTLTETKRADFPDIPAVTDEDDPDYIGDYYPCFLMISKESLETMGVEMKTGEGWTWDPTGRKFDFIKCPNETLAWNPFLNTWKRKTTCKTCPRVSYYDNKEGYNLLDHISEDNIFNGVFCECDLCPVCKQLVSCAGSSVGCYDDHRDCK